MPFSATLLLEPIDTYSFVPSGEAVTFFVQWWLIGPAGRSAILRGAAVIAVWPGVKGKASRASVSATYRVLPTSAMPNGESRLASRVYFRASPAGCGRSRVMRLGLGVPAPARFMIKPAT